MIRTEAGPGSAIRNISKKASPRHRAFNETKRIGPAALSNDALLRACRSAHKPWIKCGKCFREAYKRAKQGRIPGVRTQADLCRSIGCSLRWLQLILDGSAADSNAPKKHIKNPEPDSGTREPKSDPAYVYEITKYAQDRLQLLMIQDPQRFREICRLLASAFTEAARRIEL